MNSRSLIAILVGTALVAAIAVRAGSARAAETWQSLEKRGDYHLGKATPALKVAVDSWEQAERQALRVGSEVELERARRERARGLLVLGEATAFEKLVRAHRLAGVTPWPVSVPVDLSGADHEALEKSIPELVAFFRRAGRAYFRLPDREERDLPLLFEALGFSSRLQADLVRSRAAADFRQALSLLPATADPAAIVGRVRLLYKLRDLDAAQEAFAKARARESELSRDQLLELLRLGRLLARFQGDREAFEKLNAELIRLGDTRGDQSQVQLGLRGIVRGSPGELVQVARTLIEARRKLRLSAEERDLCLYLAAGASLEVGQFSAAGQLLEQVESPQTRGRWFRARVAGRRGLAAQNAGDYEAAGEALRSALELVDGLSRTDDFVARVRLNLAGVRIQLGDYPTAREEAQSILRTHAGTGYAVAARLVLGDCLYFASARSRALRQSNLEDALSAYQLAGNELGSAKIDDPTLRVELGNQIKIHAGNVYRELSLLATSETDERRLRQKAIEAATTAFEQASRENAERLRVVAAANLAELYLEDGRPAEARKLARWSLERASGQGQFENLWRSHWYLARIADATGDVAEADREYQLAARLIEEQRARILDSDRKSGFMSSKQSFFEDLVRHQLDRGKPELAFNTAERARSRAFIESLGLRFLLFSADQERVLYREYISLLGRAAVARQGQSSYLGVKDRPSENYESLREKIEALREKISRHPSVSPLVKSLVLGKPATLGLVQQGLGAGEVMLEYFSTGERLVAFVIAANRFEAVELTVTPSDLARDVEVFLDAATADSTRAGSLYRQLVAPVEASVESLSSGGDVARVTIVPWGPLHRLPFEALVTPRGYLVERWELSYLPSATVLKYLPRDGEGGAPAQLVALVDPDTDYDRDGQSDFPQLPYARVEVEGISSLFPSKVVLSGKEAEEDAGRRLAPSGQVVHLACHGEFFPSRPLDSTLYLSRGASTDGKLRAAEILGLDLKKSRLITLSGCETGRFDVGPGDDPVGLGTAFLHSGARSLLVSLWKVEDQATAQLMERFYREWLRGKHGNRARALRAAKLSLLREGKFEKPGQWASFILIGIR